MCVTRVVDRSRGLSRSEPGTLRRRRGLLLPHGRGLGRAQAPSGRTVAGTAAFNSIDNHLVQLGSARRINQPKGGWQPSLLSITIPA